jgi:serine/threonine protein kinase/tetratricopeptide (TPR) repeat protein
MDSERWIRLQHLFAELRDAPPEFRARRLAELAQTDADLCADLGSLLDADSNSGPLDSLAERFTSVSGVLSSATLVPDRIGAYRVIGELGRGGMGTVYLAERADGHFEHRVAIKLIEESRSDDPQHRRFLAERQILADLVHPNIARLLDGGIIDDGRPYLVMEYVDGQPITDWCDQRGLSLRARLTLFCDVCAAVQHAHQNLVIHRDIKPSNILVASDGRVRLLDFGIAELVDPAATSPHDALHELRAMTPEYASPEQVSGDPLTTSTDIYSLGVLLYVLITGRHPYALARGSLAEMADVICHREPDAPSVRAARGDVDAASRATSPEQLARSLRGDLDGITTMALRKQPADRYASADMLRQDIERHLAGHPVDAHRGGIRYRAGKFVRRHRIAVTATGLMFGGLLFGLTAAVVQGRRATRERIRAEQALAQSEGIAGFMLELFRSGGADDTASAAGLTALDILRRGAARATALSDQPLVQARLLDVVGQMSLHLGQLDEAQRRLEQAVSIRRQAGVAAQAELPASLIHLAWVHRARNDRAQARALVSEALGLREQTLGADHPDVAEALYEMGWLTSGREQEELYRQALAVFPDSGALAAQRVSVLLALATNLRRQGRLDETVATSREAVRAAEAAFGPQHQATGDAMVHLADHVRDIEQDHVAAERLYRRGLELIERHFGEQSIRLLHGLHSLGTLLSNRGDTKAEQVFRRAIAIRRAATGPEHPEMAEGLQLLAGELARQERWLEAESLQRQALAHSIRTVGERHPVVTTQRLPRLALILAQQGKMQEADALFASAVGQNTASLAVSGEVLRDYGRLLTAKGDLPKAEQQLLRSLQLLGQHYAGQDHPNVRESKRALMELYQRWGKAELVERYRVPPGRWVAY